MGRPGDISQDRPRKETWDVFGIVAEYLHGTFKGPARDVQSASRGCAYADGIDSQECPAVDTFGTSSGCFMWTDHKRDPWDV